jgi:hypothetical protein
LQENNVMSKKAKYPIAISVFIVVGSLKDLSSLDFSSKNISCLNLAGPELEGLSNNYQPVDEKVYSIYETIIKDAEKISDELQHIHVLIPKNFNQPVEDMDFVDCINVVKLIYPSDVQFHTIANFYLYENQNIEWISSTYYNFYPSGNDRHDNYLICHFEKDINEVNNFIKLFFERIINLRYVQIAFDAYLTSFGNMPNHMAFISLCISLETIVEGTAELTFKISRLIALICADNRFYANRIFENVHLIYKLRSKIVHGSEIKIELINTYLPYLRNLISRMITQLVYLNQPSALELQRELLFAGLSDRNALFSGNEKPLNMFSYAATLGSLK